MKIYTKNGDKGQTSLIGGLGVTKDDIRLEAYGSLDELNAWVGLLCDVLEDSRQGAFLGEVQHVLFTIGSMLATPSGSSFLPPALSDDLLSGLEREIDYIDTHLKPLANFILPGGHLHISYCHLARTVCRRAERQIVHLSQTEQVDSRVLAYANRLSDYFFMLARLVAKQANVSEIIWKPRPST